MVDDPDIARALPERRVLGRDPAAQEPAAHQLKAPPAWLWRIRSKRICILAVPVTGRITAWTDIARAGGSSAFWQTNEPSSSCGGGAEAPDAVAEPIAAAATPAATPKASPTRVMRKYQQPQPRKVPERLAAEGCNARGRNGQLTSMARDSTGRSAIEARFADVFRHLGLLTAYARRRGAHDPDEIAAEAMAIAWRRLADVPTVSPPGYRLQTLDAAGRVLITDAYDPGE